MTPAETTDYDPALDTIEGRPWRAVYPLWERTPATCDDWLTAAQSEFPVLGLCQVAQRRGLVAVERGFRNHPADLNDALCAFIGLSRRFKAMGQALEGEAIRFTMVKQMLGGAT